MNKRDAKQAEKENANLVNMDRSCLEEPNKAEAKEEESKMLIG